MSDKGKHLSQLDLLQLHDFELDDGDRLRALVHLGECAECSLAFQKTSSLSKEVNLFLWPTSPLQNNDAQRESLKKLLQKESQNQQHIVGLRRTVFNAVYAAVGLIALGLSSFGIYQRVHSSQYRQSEVLSIPDPDLTPGDTRPTAYADICPAKDNDKDPPVAAAVVWSIFREYKISSHKQDKYQVDYLISPQLGGTNEIRNLWPQSYEATIWNARVKDALEDRLHLMVCSHEIELSEAQRAIALDWIGAYKLYFHTQSPLPTEAMIER